ncbi:hypothetical protein ACFL08_05695 [Patescibacteria group bacterium]
MNKKYLSFIILILIATGIIFFLRVKKVNNYAIVPEEGVADVTSEEELEVSESKILFLDTEKEATHFSKVAGNPEAYWMRGMSVIWNDVEREKGEFDWSHLDEILSEGNEYFEGGVYNLAMIWPYANWDQKTCHNGKKYEATGHLKGGDEDLMLGTPCDFGAYAKFLEKVVERYDGDGIDDAPGLRTPVKYWEIMNEPAMQGGSIGGAGEDLKFFVGTSEEYFNILKTSYEVIKKSDSDAKVAHGGMAGMHKKFVDFWTPIFEMGGGEYFDIANIHAVSVDENAEDLYVIKFKKFLDKYDLGDKPIWVTEAQFGDLMRSPGNLNSFDEMLVRSSVFSLAHGADKIFLIENWIHWDQAFEMDIKKNKKNDGDLMEKFDDKNMEDKKDKMEKFKEFNLGTENNSTHKAYINLVKKLNSFDKIEIIKDESIDNLNDHQGSTSVIGQYKFIDGDQVAYVLWGNYAVPEEIKGDVVMTDIYGNFRNMKADEIVATKDVIFVELLE